MTQPPKEKSLVVEALTYQRDGYFPESPFYEQLDKAIRIAEIEGRIVEALRGYMLNSEFDRLIDEHDKAIRQNEAKPIPGAWANDYED